MKNNFITGHLQLILCYTHMRMNFHHQSHFPKILPLNNKHLNAFPFCVFKQRIKEVLTQNILTLNTSFAFTAFDLNMAAYEPQINTQLGAVINHLLINVTLDRWRTNAPESCLPSIRTNTLLTHGTIHIFIN